jgi:hypothetical protein
MSKNNTMRLDQYEAKTAPFAAMMSRRRIHEDTLAVDMDSLRCSRRAAHQDLPRGMATGSCS